MFETLIQQPPDKILMLMQMYREDPRDQKIDLGVGVFKNAEGVTPIMGAIKRAERHLWENQTTKSYVGLTGDPSFNEAMIGLVLGSAVPRVQVASAATPGGTGAVRQALELFRMANPDLRVWVSDPTWPNHLSILKYLGIETKVYRYFDAETRAVDFGGMMEDLADLRAGDVVLLHGCCHNPTGANLNPAQWDDVIARLADAGATPFIDIAYQGFGDGLDADAAATRKVAANLPETVIAASCSKNFGIYRERTGCLITITHGTHRGLSQETLAFLNRQNFSFPPDHGASLVTLILTDDALREEWEKELEATRLYMLELREQLAGDLRRASGSDRFAFLAEHRGMFSRLGASPTHVERLRTDHGIYMVGDSRMNIAGLNPQSIPVLAEAIIASGI
ncbi:MAG: amino acid aminotransferase [Pseudomonadota bacterium]